MVLMISELRWAHTIIFVHNRKLRTLSFSFIEHHKHTRVWVIMESSQLSHEHNKQQRTLVWSGSERPSDTLLLAADSSRRCVRWRLRWWLKICRTLQIVRSQRACCCQLKRLRIHSISSFWRAEKLGARKKPPGGRRLGADGR